MRSRIKLLVGLTLALLGLFIFLSQSPVPAKACSGLTTAANHTPPSLAQRVDTADYVFRGRVVEMYEDTSTGVALYTPSDRDKLVKVEVLSYYKGTGPKYVTFRGFSSATCSYNVSVSGEEIFFAYGDPYTEFKVENRMGFSSSHSPIDGYVPIENPTEEFLVQLSAAINHQPVPPFTPAPVATPTPATPTQLSVAIKFEDKREQENWAGWIVGAILLGLIEVGLLLIWMRRWRLK